jgi:hypothetical protein
MKDDMKDRLEALKDNYIKKTGHFFKYFYCPILYRDEKTPLCKGHIVNDFPNSPRAWTVQRKDVDNFYGSKFESDFLALQHSEKYSPDEILIDKDLSKSIKPKIMQNGKYVDYYYDESNIPEHFSRVIVENSEKSATIVLKKSPDEMLAQLDSNWEIDISRDLRLPALVSLIKSAHLTLFNILGYEYALSAGGHFVGHDILGLFYEQNKSESKQNVLKNAHPFFRPFLHMVRPVPPDSIEMQGTISDNHFLACRDSRNNIWAVVVFIRTDQKLHSVLIPIFDSTDAIPRFLGFLENTNETIEASLCIYGKDKWKISTKTVKLVWPKIGDLYPEINEP